MHLNCSGASLSRLLFLLLGFTLNHIVLAAEPAGVVEVIFGEAYALDGDGERRILLEDSSIYVGETLLTGEGTTLQLRFEDDTRFFLGERAEFLIEEFHYLTDIPDSLTAKIIKGTFRFISGLIAGSRAEAMRVETPVAAIGIRGTHVAGETDVTSSVIILLEPVSQDISSGIVVSNDYGSVIIDEPGFGTEIPDEYSPPSPPRRMRLQSIENLMRSIQSIQRRNIPRPRVR